MTGIGPCGWLVTAIEHDAAPDALVSPVQVCAVVPLPRVNVTVWPPSPEPITGSSLVSTPESVIGWPFWAVVPPV